MAGTVIIIKCANCHNTRRIEDVKPPDFLKMSDHVSTPCECGENVWFIADAKTSRWAALDE
jgi:hypothetical protein